MGNTWSLKSSAEVKQNLVSIFVKVLLDNTAVKIF